MSESHGDRRKNKRNLIQTEMEFIIYLDSFKAETIDVSKTGIQFKTSAPIIIQLQYNDGGKIQRRHATLVWAEKTNDKEFRYGFEFVPEITI